jgi:predicted nucleotidyltransferase
MDKKYSNRSTRNLLSNEAVLITKELGDITFIGAVAVFFHTRGSRESRDLDFAVATKIPNEELLDKKYKIIEGRRKPTILTPRSFKIDIYTKEVGDIPVKDIIHRAKVVPVGKKGVNKVKIASLEDLIITKYRDNREQDIEDLIEIANTEFHNIDWSLLQSLTKDKVEYTNITNTMNLSRR